MDEYIKKEDIEQKIQAGLNNLVLGHDAIEVLGMIYEMPAADVATVQHGRWLPQVVLGQKAWDCSECKTLGSPHWKWCPVCGCKMDLEG